MQDLSSIRLKRGLPSIRLEWGLVPTNSRRCAHGFTLIELIITVAVLSVLTMAVIPLVRVSMQRQKEQLLRAELRQMRDAVDQFHMEARAANQQVLLGGNAGANPGTQLAGNAGNNAAALPFFNDPRVRVYISDLSIFTADNPDRYPPTLDTLVTGVSVLPTQPPASMTTGGVGLTGTTGIAEATQSVAPKTKIYLRAIPIDPMTGKADWDTRSCYQPSDDKDWDQLNVFSVHSKSKGQALNGENYSDW